MGQQKTASVSIVFLQCSRCKKKCTLRYGYCASFFHILHFKYPYYNVLKYTCSNAAAKKVVHTKKKNFLGIG